MNKNTFYGYSPFAGTYIHTYIYTYIYIYIWDHAYQHDNFSVPFEYQNVESYPVGQLRDSGIKTDASMRKIVKVMAPYEKKTCGAPVY